MIAWSMHEHKAPKAFSVKEKLLTSYFLQIVLSWCFGVIDSQIDKYLRFIIFLSTVHCQFDFRSVTHLSGCNKMPNIRWKKNQW